VIGGKFERILVAFGLIMAITLVAGIPADQAKAAFAGGTGTVGDPFQINDCAQLAEIDDTTSNLSKAYVLTANISCSGSFSPLVNGSTYFSGTLNGAGYQISGLSISCSTAYCGLFARVTTNATFQNLSIQNPSITSTAGCVGALFGYGIGFTSTNVDVVGGTVSGGSSTSPCIGSNVGGLAGSVANGTVTGSDVSATVSGTNDQVGGVIGWSYVSSGACTSGSAKLANSTFSGTVTGLSSVGGLVGEFYRASSDGSCGIFDSSNTGSVTSNGTPCSNFGGVAGSMQGGVVSNVSNTATISASSCPSTGGVIGQLRGMDADDNTSLTRAWNSGLVQGRWYIGGVVGYCDASYATISRSFNIGSISTTSGQVGGVVGVSSCIVSDSFSRASISSTSASWMGGAFGEGISSAIGTESTRVYSASSSYGFLGQNSGGFVCVASFWDTTLKSTSPASCGTGLVGKSTTDMKTQATFTDAGWDFVGESTNGTNDYWAIDPTINLGYPYLVGVGVSALTADSTAPSAPNTPDLTTDTGSSSTDDLTNNNTPTISVTAAEAGGTVTVTAAKSGSSDVTCTLTGSTSGNSCALGMLADGTWTITARHADAAGNTSSTSTALSITIDTTAPTRSSFTPSAGAAGVAITTSPTITFDENIVAGSGNITIYSGASCSTTFATIAGNDTQVTISSGTATIDPTSDLDLTTQYCITYAATTFTDTAGNQVSALSSTATISFTTTNTPPTTMPSTSPAAPAETSSTTTTIPPLTTRTLSISGAVARYTVTQDGPGLTAVPSEGGGAISWSSLTPSVCNVSTIAIMSVLSAQSSVSVGRLSVVGTCTISAVVAATSTHSSASTSVSFIITRARPTVTVSTFDDEHFFAKITLPSAIASSSALLRSMYDDLTFVSLTPETCEIDVIATFQESASEFSSSWIGLHGRPDYNEQGACTVRAELPLGDRWFRVFSNTNATLGEDLEQTPTTVAPTTTARPTTTTTTVVTSSSSTVVSTTTVASSETTGPAPSITSFGPTSSIAAVPLLELDVEKQIVLENGDTEIVFTRESLIKTAENVGVREGAIRLRTASSAWTETKLPDANDLRLVIRQTDVELKIEVEPKTGEVVRIAVPIVVTIDNGFELQNFTITFIAGAALMAWWLLVWRRRKSSVD
jgi:hypothetical protein